MQSLEYPIIVTFWHHREETDITIQDIIANLSHAIDHAKVSRFNISRANIWDGAVRGFRRTTYCETFDMFVKFTDDAGALEEGIGSETRVFNSTNETSERPSHF